MPTGLSVSRAAALFGAVCALAASPVFANGAQPIDLGGPVSLFIDCPPPLLDTTTCTPVDFHVVDNTGTSGGSYQVDLAALPSDVPVLFYDTADCSSAVTSVSSSGTGTFYVRPTNDEYRFASIRASVTVQSSTSHAVLPVQVGDTRPTVMAVVGDGAVSANSCSGLMSVMFKDGSGFPMMGITGAGAATVSLVAQSGSNITFYSDAHCTQAASQLPVLGDSVVFSFLAPTQGTFFIKASTNLAGVVEVSRTVTVGPASTAAGRMSFISAPQIIPARSDALSIKSCSAPFVLEAQTAQGASMTSPGEAVVNLTAVAGGSSTSAVSFFSDPDCTAPFSATNPLKFSTGQGQIAFYANAAKAGTFGLVATVSNALGNASAAQLLEVAPGAASKVFFFKEPSTFVHGQPQTSPVKVYLSDADGNPTALQTPITLGLGQTTATFTKGMLSKSYDPAAKYASWMDLELTGVGSGWGRLSLTMTASTTTGARPLSHVSQPFTLVENALDVSAQLTPSQPKKCEAVTVALSLNGATTQASNDIYTVCVDDQSSATFETYEGFTLVSTSSGRCVTGTLSAPKSVTLKNANAQQSSLLITNQTLKLPSSRVTLDWAETGVDCGGGAPQTVALTVSVDTPRPTLGSTVLLDIRARDLNGGPAAATAIKIVGGNLRIEEIVDTTGVTLFPPDELRFADTVPDTIRLRAIVTGSGAVKAIALDDNAQTIGQSEALQLDLETPTEAATFGCSTSGSSFALVAAMLVFAWLVVRRSAAPVRVRFVKAKGRRGA